MNKLGMLAILSFIFFESCKQENTEYVPYYKDATFTPYFDLSKSQIKDLHTIADFEFMDQDSQIVNNNTFKGKLYVANYFFTICPGICPKLTESMRDVQAAFLKDTSVLLLSHTVTPWVDSIPKLKNYALDKDVISDKWHLVTGEKEEIYNLARTSYFAEESIGLQLTKDDFLHTEHLVLIDTEGHIRGLYNGTNPEQVQYLISDIQILLDK